MQAAIFRPTVGLLEKENQTLLYAFTYLGYTRFTELNLGPLAGKSAEDILASFRQDSARMS